MNFIDKLKGLKDDSVDCIIITDTSFNKDLLEESKRVISQEGNIWCFSSPKKVLNDLKSIRESNLINIFEDWAIYTTETNTQPNSTVRTDILHIVKNKKYIWHNAEFLREVICPYIEKGEKKGWDYYNGLPMRWTGLGNVFYSSDIRYIYALLILLASNKGSVVESNEDIVLKIANTIERMSDSTESIPNFKEEVKSHITTSESGTFSYNEREFMKKVE